MAVNCTFCSWQIWIWYLLWKFTISHAKHFPLPFVCEMLNFAWQMDSAGGWPGCVGKSECLGHGVSSFPQTTCENFTHLIWWNVNAEKKLYIYIFFQTVERKGKTSANERVDRTEVGTAGDRNLVSSHFPACILDLIRLSGLRAVTQSYFFSCSPCISVSLLWM